MEICYTIAVLSIATSVIAVTLTRSKIFKGLRLFLKDRNAWMYKLFTCPYCMSHWVAIVFACLVCPRLSLFWGWPGLPVWLVVTMEILISVFVIVAFATLVGALIQRVNPFAGDEPPPEEEEEKDAKPSSGLNHENWSPNL